MDVPEPPLTSLDLTHVYYNPSDPISILCAWLALLPQALLIVYATALYCTRELELALAFLGQLSCEAVNYVLKRLIREARPKELHGKGYGMPSSHAQFVGFFALYVGLLLGLRGLGGAALPRWRRAVYMGAAVVGSVFIAGSRVYLGYHTGRQVVVGYGAGLVWAAVWFGTTGLLRGGWREWVVRCGGMLWVRDTCLRDDLVVEGWKRAQSKRE